LRYVAACIDVIRDGAGHGRIQLSTRCVIKPRRGRKLVISNLHFRGLANFEDRAGQFRPFVNSLIRSVAAANPEVAFISGMPRALWIAWIVLAAAIVIATPLLVILVVALWSRGEEISVSTMLAAVFCLSILLGIFPLVRVIRRNRPRPFDPRAAGTSPN
jgi:hypothetical protein